MPAAVNSPEPQTVDDDPATPQTSYDVKKAFGAIARIHTNRLELSPRQQEKLRAFIDRYVARTRKSKEYTQEHRVHMADPVSYTHLDVYKRQPGNRHCAPWPAPAY